jgi:hypothetical protein
VSARAETPRQAQHVVLRTAGPHALEQDQQVQLSLLFPRLEPAGE